MEYGLDPATYVVLEEYMLASPHLVSRTDSIWTDGEIIHIIWDNITHVGSATPPGIPHIIIPELDPWVGTFERGHKEVRYTPQKQVVVNGAVHEDTVQVKDGDRIQFGPEIEYQLYFSVGSTPPKPIPHRIMEHYTGKKAREEEYNPV